MPVPLSHPIAERRPTVLLIDDSRTDLRLLMDFLALHRLRVSVSLDGDKGYQQAVLQQPELILLDLRMPRPDGFAVCRRLKANPETAHIPVIFLTAATDLDARLEGFALGAVDYICKPFDEREVLARVGVHLQLGPKSVVMLAAASPQAESGSLDAVLVTSAQNILRDAMVSPPSLENLARLIGTNRRKLNDAFQNRCAMTVFGWLREERLRKAHELLVGTDTPIAHIADHLGYSTPTNFAKAFRERFRCSPRSLRAMRQAGFSPNATQNEPHAATP